MKPEVELSFFSAQEFAQCRRAWKKIFVFNPSFLLVYSRMTARQPERQLRAESLRFRFLC